MVRKGVVAADIGTDHAYLPSYLVLSGICPRALACDLRKGPLENAAETLERRNIADKITLRLSDGLDELSPGEADDIIMAGMGGILIAKLLERTEWVKNKNIRLILQPMSHAEEVRLFLCNNGFDIIEERTCRDDGAYIQSYVPNIRGKIEAFLRVMSSTESLIQTMISRENSLRDSISGLKYARRLCAKRTSNSTRRSTAKRPVSVWKVF